MKSRNRDILVRPASPLARMLDSEEVAAIARANSAFILDVRSESEWEVGHIETATLVPLPVLHTRLDEIPRDRPVIVHCQRGSRSAVGAATLDAFGFLDVHELSGGVAAWEAAGHSLIK